MSRDNTQEATVRETVQAFFQLLGAGDADRMADLFAEEIDWYVPGTDSAHRLPSTSPSRTARSSACTCTRTPMSSHKPWLTELIVGGMDCACCLQIAATLGNRLRPLCAGQSQA
jgi:hypothetical protein